MTCIRGAWLCFEILDIDGIATDNPGAFAASFEWRQCRKTVSTGRFIGAGTLFNRGLDGSRPDFYVDLLCHRGKLNSSLVQIFNTV